MHMHTLTILTAALFLAFGATGISASPVPGGLPLDGPQGPPVAKPKVLMCVKQKCVEKGLEYCDEAQARIQDWFEKKRDVDAELELTTDAFNC
jgi:hypothetical protein